MKGVILNENNLPVPHVTVSIDDITAQSNENGFYMIRFDSNIRKKVVFTHVTKQPVTVYVTLMPNEDYEYNFVMKDQETQLADIILQADGVRKVEGMQSIRPAVLRTIPGANPGVENILKTLPGFNSNDELSTQYAVRGGNYDENLVYVNGIEVYRPFLIRSGQQEGLSFTNTEMVQNIDFSAGGFQAKYGDKMSSVLDITYRTPKRYAAALDMSLLGGSLTVEGVSPNQKWSNITSVRYRDNSLLVNSKETATNFRPRFTDVQTFLNFNPNMRWQWSFLGNISQNKYAYQPLTRQTNFGTIDQPIALQIFYDGIERDQYDTYFGAVKSTFQKNDDNKYEFHTSIYHTKEQEYFDIHAAYFLGEVDANIGSETFGDVTFNRGVGTQLNHGRNDLDALIINAEIKGWHKYNTHIIEWGTKYTREDVRDRLVEWEVIDSTGYSINAPDFQVGNQQPYESYTGPLVPYQNRRATNFVTIDRFSGFMQWSYLINSELASWSLNAGIRAHAWNVSGDSVAESSSQVVVSPRAQLSIKPFWKKDMVFRIATGVYHQPPFYREMRDYMGVVNASVKSQKSWHFVLSNEYSFEMLQRENKFRLTSEIYYKGMSDVNPYTLDNVRIRYAANNSAEAYAYGLDLRLNGEFVPGTESWFSMGYMKTEENIEERGYIARPTDQRLKFGILFQDYIPSMPSMKLYLNLVYNTGLPGGAPSYADPYDYQLRLRDYRRADVGFSYVLTEGNDQRPDGHWLKLFRDLSIGLEIFNLFNNQNSITNTWVRDVYTKSQYAVPNYMTSRVFNVKLTARL